jgi:hypothetical protein
MERGEKEVDIEDPQQTKCLHRRDCQYITENDK